MGVGETHGPGLKTGDQTLDGTEAQGPRGKPSMGGERGGERSLGRAVKLGLRTEDRQRRGH